ncbi:MAG TPA: alpha/beta fold hydrolase [Mycobacterium sp.]
MTTRYDYYRNGAGEPLVLLHGTTASWRVWHPVLDRLAQHYDVFAPTLPGHRAGPPLPGPPTIDAIVDGVEATLDDAGISTAHIAGNSLGGLIALELLRRGRARSVVNFNGPFAWRNDRDIARLILFIALNEGLVRSGLIQAAAHRSGAVRRRILRQVMNHGDRLSAEQVSTVFADARHCVLARPLLRTVLAEGPRPRLDVGAVPVHIAWSHGDRVVPYDRYGAPTAAHLPGAHLIRLAGVGHVPMWDNPELVVQTIDRAISSALSR